MSFSVLLFQQDADPGSAVPERTRARLRRANLTPVHGPARMPVLSGPAGQTRRFEARAVVTFESSRTYDTRTGPICSGALRGSEAIRRLHLPWALAKCPRPLSRLCAGGRTRSNSRWTAHQVLFTLTNYVYTGLVLDGCFVMAVARAWLRGQFLMRCRIFSLGGARASRGAPNRQSIGGGFCQLSLRGPLRALHPLAPRRNRRLCPVLHP